MQNVVLRVTIYLEYIFRYTGIYGVELSHQQWVK